MNEKEITRKFLSSFNKLKNQSLWKGCFHEDENCNEKIIKAHSIQNNKILNKISEDGCVYMIGHNIGSDYGLEVEMKPEGRKKATTFTGFCGYHDGTIFHPIENFDYTVGNKEQEFLFAYRALAKEYHSKISVKEISLKCLEYIRNKEFDKLSTTFENNKPSDEHIQFMNKMFLENLYGTNDSTDRLERYRKDMNSFLDTSNFNQILTDVFTFNEEYHIAVSGLTFIEKDLLGNTVNDISDYNKVIYPLFITVIPQDGKTYVLLSYFERSKRRYSFIDRQIKPKDIETQKVILSNIIINYIENFAVSPIRWKNINKTRQKEIYKRFVDSSLEVEKELVSDKTFNIFI